MSKRGEKLYLSCTNTPIRGESLLNCTYFVHFLYLINNIYKKYSNTTSCKNFCNNNCKKNSGKKRFKIYRYKKIICSKKIKINFYSLTNLTIMMGAKVLRKNSREPVKYSEPSI